ncbi:hypothetical protein [Paenibacillus kobensis]|uniref:hypothetical protein n=1 Tax=Paenibacillus kobensis TaxID=59841 RepID=UPI000FDBAC6A|nr:hypothetical protein [Paenibacillus kobensis]
MTFRQVLSDSKIGHRFREDVDRAISNLGLPKLNWGEGVWQKLLQLKDQRIKLVHSKQEQSDLFPEATVAENYVIVARDSIIEVFKHTGLNVPHWIRFDMDP